MSIEVPLDGIEAAARPLGAAAFAVVGVADGHPPVLHTPVWFSGATLHVQVGRRMARALVANPAITLIWPPASAGGMSLLVDAQAVAAPSEAGGEVRLRPVGAVWHRPAPESDGDQGESPAAG